MASPQASIFKPSKKPKFTIIPPKQLFIDLTKEDTKTPSPKFQVSSPSAPNAPFKSPSTKDTSSLSIDYTPKSLTLLSSPFTNGYLNFLLSPPPRVPPPPLTQAPNSMEITLSLSPVTPLDVHHNSPSLSSPIIGHHVPWNLLEAHDMGISISEGSPDTRTESQMETYKTVSQDIRDQLNAEAEAVQIILTGIDNDIYSTVDACPDACEMWKSIKRFNNGVEIWDSMLQLQGIWACSKGMLETEKGEGCSLSQGKDVVELEVHYMYMAQLQEVSPDVADSRPIFDDEPLQKVSNDDHYNVFAMESEHPEQSESVRDTYPIEQDAHNVIINSLDMSYDREEIDQNDDDNDLTKERELLASLIEKLKYEIDDSKNRNKFLETSNKFLIEKLKGEIKDFKNKKKSLESSNNHFKEANNKLSETNNLLYTDFKKSEAEIARRNSIEYASQMEIDCAQDLKAQLQDKGNVISELKKLIEKLKGKYTDTKFEKSSVIRQPNAFKSQRPSILGKPTTFSNSFERRDFSKSKSVTQNNVSNDFSKPGTTQTLPPNKKSIINNMNVLALGMYKLHTDHNQARTSQLPQDSRKTNKRVSFSTSVIPTTSVSRPQLKSNPMRDRVMRNNSQGKKQEVEDQRRNVKLSKNKMSVTTCNDSLKAKTLNVNSVFTMCDKCVLNDKHDMNDQISPILGYGDLVQGAVTIKSVYYVEGLNHNLFSVGQFCDADLEVAFRKSTCYIRDLKRNDLLTGSRGTDLYSITLQDINCPNPIYLMAKATSPQAWFWHRRLSHLNFDTINLLLKNDIVTLYAYFATERILHQTSVARTPKQNEVVERRNRTLVEAARTMLSVAKVPLFFWAEAIATACFTQNRSLVIHRHEKTPYHIINDRKPLVKFFHIFGSLCYIIRDESSAVSTTDAPNQHQHHTTPLNTHTTPAPTCGDKLVSWSSKKQDYTLMSSVEAVYVSLSACCTQVLWMRTQLIDYGFHFDKIHMFKYLIRRLGMRCLTPDELEVLANNSA
nr:integrase, catalytic region, zinc finger, CCHC-type, peptidase aspartic, catalytic [Tanacetum cinerariifolium]